MDAPIFHPTPGAFAFSDPQPLTGLLAAPLWLLDPALAYNGVLLLFTTLNGFTVTRLLCHRGLGARVALLGGVLAQCLPFLTHERGVLQLQALFAAAWTLDGLWLLAESGSWRRGWALGAGIAVTFLTSEYYGLFALVLLVPAVVVNLSAFRHRSAAAGLALGLLVAAAAVIPPLWSQSRHLERMGFERRTATVERYSASPRDYSRMTPRSLSGRLLARDAPAVGGRQYLSPGWILLVLALVGAVPRSRSFARSSWTLSLIATAVLAFLLSLGPGLSLAGWEPYRSLQGAVPGLASLRSPFRFGVLVQLSVLGLAAGALDRIARQGRFLLCGALLLLAAIELAPLPSRTTPVPATLSAGSLDSPAVFLPYVRGRRTADYLETVAVMNAVLPTGASLVNGYSGFFPALNAQLKELLEEFPAPRGLAALRALGVQSLLVRAGALDPSQSRRLVALVRAGELVDRGRRLELRVLRLVGAKLRPAAEYDGRWSVQWRSAGTEVELRLEPLDLGGEVFVVAPEVAPLHFRARWRGGGARGETTLATKGAFLLFEKSEPLPRLRLTLPDRGVAYTVELLDLRTGRSIGSIRVPPART